MTFNITNGNGSQFYKVFNGGIFPGMSGRKYLDNNPPQQIITLPEGSWGEGKFHWIWFNEWTKWTWEIIGRSRCG